MTHLMGLVKTQVGLCARTLGAFANETQRWRAAITAAVLATLSALPVKATEYPEFTGVYLRYGDRFIEIPPIDTVTGYVAPSEPPASASRFNRFRTTTIAGTTVSPNNMLLIEGGLTIEGYIENVVLIPYHRENGETVSLVTVQRPDFRLTDRVNYVSRLDDLMRSMPQLTPRQQAQCADFKARGMAPLAGGFDDCRAGESSFKPQGIQLIDADWGVDFDTFFSERLINEFTTEYVLLRQEDTADPCRYRMLAGDLKNEKNLRSFGWYLKANTGARYLVACPNQIPNRENFPMNEQVHESLKARLTENCDAFGFEC